MKKIVLSAVLATAIVTGASASASDKIIGTCSDVGFYGCKNLKPKKGDIALLSDGKTKIIYLYTGERIYDNGMSWLYLDDGSQLDLYENRKGENKKKDLDYYYKQIESKKTESKTRYASLFGKKETIMIKDALGESKKQICSFEKLMQDDAANGKVEDVMAIYYSETLALKQQYKWRLEETKNFVKASALSGGVSGAIRSGKLPAKLDVNILSAQTKQSNINVTADINTFVANVHQWAGYFGTNIQYFNQRFILLRSFLIANGHYGYTIPEACKFDADSIDLLDEIVGLVSMKSDVKILKLIEMFIQDKDYDLITNYMIQDRETKRIYDLMKANFEKLTNKKL